VTLLAAEFLKQAKPFVEDGVHPQVKDARQLIKNSALLTTYNNDIRSYTDFFKTWIHKNVKCSI